MSAEEDQVKVIVDNVEFMIADWLDKQAARHEKRFLEYGYTDNELAAHYYRNAANGIRTGEWRE